MKRIAIFCDGTWNRPDARFATNVYKLHSATLQTPCKFLSSLKNDSDSSN